jgi:hypothetical protein
MPGTTMLSLSLSLALGMSAIAPASAATLLHSYSFDNGASDGVADADGTLLNGAVVVDSALVLDGVDDFVQFDSHLVPTSGSYAVSLFFKQDRAQTTHVEYISQGETGGQGFYLGQDPFRQVRATDSWLSTGIALPAVGEWHHLAFSVDAAANQSTLYLDGVAVANRGFAIATTSNGTHTRFGTQFQTFNEFFDGSLDEVMIFEGALSAGEIATLASASPGTTPVPLPASLWLTIPGLLALARRRRLPGR